MKRIIVIEDDLNLINKEEVFKLKRFLDFKHWTYHEEEVEG